MWQHNNDERHRSTLIFIEELGDGYTVGTREYSYVNFSDLNECWTDAEPAKHMELIAGIKGVQPTKKHMIPAAVRRQDVLTNHRLKAVFQNHFE